MRLRSVSTLAGALLLVQGTTLAQGFEGVMEERMLEVTPDVLEMVLGDAMWGPDELSGARAAFDIPIDRLLQYEDQGVDVQTMKLYLKNGKLRSEVMSGGRVMGFQIMDTKTGTMQMGNADSRTYFEWTKEDFERIQAFVQESLEEAGVDPEVAAEIESQQAGEISETGQTATINGMEAKSIEILSDEELSRGWYAEDRFGVSDVIRTLGEYANAQYGGDPETDPSDILWERGVPVLIQTFQIYSSELSIEEIVSLSEERVPDEMFVIPADFEKKPNPFLGMFGE